MLCIPKSKAGRRYIRRLIPTMMVYLVFLFLSGWIFHHLHPTGIAVYLIAVLPALPLVGSLVVLGFYIAEETDEFERSIIIQSMLWGIGGALSVSTIWGALEDFATTPPPHLSTFYIYIFFWIFMGISQPIIRLRYQ
jgi:hypothetical protein